MDKVQASHLALWKEGQNITSSATAKNTAEPLQTEPRSSKQNNRTKIRNQRRRETAVLIKEKLKTAEANLALAQPKINKAAATATAYKNYADEANRTLSDARKAHPEFALELKIKPPNLNTTELAQPISKPINKKPKKSKKKKTTKTVDNNNNNNTLDYYRKQPKPTEIIKVTPVELPTVEKPVAVISNIDDDDLQIPATTEPESQASKEKTQKRPKSGLKRKMTKDQKQDVRFYKSRKQELLKKGEWEGSEEKIKYAKLKRDIVVLHISKIQHGFEKP